MIINIDNYITKKKKQDVLNEVNIGLRRGFSLIITGDCKSNKCLGLLHIENTSLNYFEEIKIDVDPLLRNDSSIKKLLLNSEFICIIIYNSQHFSYEANIIKNNGDNTFDYIEQYKTECGDLIYTIRFLENKINKDLTSQKHQKLLS